MDYNESKTIPPIEPFGEKSLNFRVKQPKFLTEKPTVKIKIISNDFQDNDSFDSRIKYMPSEIIYPKNSQLYRFKIISQDNSSPIKHAAIRYSLSSLKDISDLIKDRKFFTISDNNGSFEAILPKGSHTFLISKRGYPKIYITKNIPNDNLTFSIPSPGKINFSINGDDGLDIHPNHQKVTIALKHNYDENFPDWFRYNYIKESKNSNNIVFDGIMPGEYIVTVTAFGYEKKELQLNLNSNEIDKDVTLHSLPRGVLCSTVKDNDSNGLGNVAIYLKNFGYIGSSENNGSFCIDDLPVGKTYTLTFKKDNYLPQSVNFHLQESNQTMSSVTLIANVSDNFHLDKCRYAAWVQDLNWKDIENSYEIKDIYGVWDMSGDLFYQKAQNSDKLQIYLLTLNIFPMQWFYGDLDGHLLDKIVDWSMEGVSSVAEKTLSEILPSAKWLVGKVFTFKEAKDFVDDLENTATMPEDFIADYKNIANPMGTVQGGVVDCGSLGALKNLAAPSSQTIPRDKTVIRIDDIKIFDGDNLLYSMHQKTGMQYFSDEMVSNSIAIPLELNDKVSSEKNLKVKIYLHPMNGEYDSGPLALPGSDKLCFEFIVKGGKLKLTTISANPIDYPKFGEEE